MLDTMSEIVSGKTLSKAELLRQNAFIPWTRHFTLETAAVAGEYSKNVEEERANPQPAASWHPKPDDYWTKLGYDWYASLQLSRLFKG